MGLCIIRKDRITQPFVPILRISKLSQIFNKSLVASLKGTQRLWVVSYWLHFFNLKYYAENFHCLTNKILTLVCMDYTWTSMTGNKLFVYRIINNHGIGFSRGIASAYLEKTYWILKIWFLHLGVVCNGLNISICILSNGSFGVSVIIIVYLFLVLIN